MGFLGPEKYVAEQLVTKMDGRGNFETPIGKYSTTVPGVFAAGGKYLTRILLKIHCYLFFFFFFK